MLAELNGEPRAAKAEIWSPGAGGWPQTCLAEGAAGWRSTAQLDVIQVLLSVISQPPPRDPRCCLGPPSQAARAGMLWLASPTQAQRVEPARAGFTA